MMPFHRLSLFCLFLAGLVGIGCGDNPTVDVKEDPIESPTTEGDEGDGGTITGLVLPPGVRPLVIVLRNGIDFTSTVADEEGRYSIPNLPAGEYSLQVISTGFFTDISINNLPVKEGETHEAALVILRDQAEGATIFGRVVDSVDNQPLPDAEIQVECSTGVCAPLSATSDENGDFSVDVWSGLGSNINVRKLGYRTKPIPVQALKPAQKFNLGQIQLERLPQ